MAALVVKVTEHCNSRCRYCARPLRGARTMAPAVVATLFDRVDEYLRRRPDEQVEVLWHGGEPLVLGARFFADVLAVQRQRCAGTAPRITHRLQTNLLAFSTPIAEALEALGVREVGTSFDPQPGLRGPRRDDSSRWYTRRLLRALALVEARGWRWGLIYVVTRRALARPVETFVCLTNLNLAGRVTINPVLAEGPARDLAVSADEFAQFLGAITPLWWRQRARYGAVQPFAALSALAAAGHGAVAPPARPAEARVVVEPDGQASRCGPAQSCDERYGDIGARSLEEILAASAAHEHARRERRRKTARCQSCRLLAPCGGGDLMDSFARDESESAADEWCAARLAFLERHMDPLLEREGDDR